MASIVHMNAAGRLTIPAATRAELGVAGETEFEADVEEDALVLRRVVVLRQEDAWAYTPEHRALLARAHADSREGRVHKLTEAQLQELADAQE
jgi:bifunctional DNA-binding transcriptional regulator/antitoxin component of YhaV-PrlF toxin-antitoxin module